MPGRTQDDFTEFVRASTPRLFRTAYAVCGDYQLAEDAVQAAFATAYSRWRRVSGADNPEAYVQRMVLNQLLSWRRRLSARQEVPSGATPGGGTAGSTSSPEGAVAGSDELWRALGALPPRQRAVVVLRYVEDLSVAETAAALGVREGTVKSQAAAGVARLRGRLDPATTGTPGGVR
jgi:RNA polymerase sigma-70 factor (sigma-E family)